MHDRPLDITTVISPAEPQRRQGLARFLLAWWFVYLVASPIYVFKSGLPQPADALMAVVLLTLLTGYFVRVPVFHGLYLVAAMFLALVAIINWFGWAQYRDPRFLLSSVFYAYNFGIFVAVLALARGFGPSLLTWTRAGLIAAVLMEFVFVVILPDIRGVRNYGTFNNPNQLGYWSLLTGACLLSAKSSPALGASRARVGPVDVALLCALGYIAAQTVSRAAMASLIVLFFAALYFQGTGLRMKFAIAVLSAAVVLTLSVTTTSFRELLWQDRAGVAFDRIERFGERQSDSVEGRGYDRIWEQPEYLLYGAGEGGYDRFASSVNEIHSTFGTILYSYGFLGFFLFMTLLWFIFRKAEGRHLAYFLPICAYGLTHQGLRFSLLWVFLGLVFAQTVFYEPRQRLRAAEGRSQDPRGERS